MIDDIIIQKINEAAKIEEVVGDFVKLTKKGPRYTALCPFHQDRHLGNFIVYPRGNVFRCFACEKKGGAIEFLKLMGMSFREAVAYLGKKYNIETNMESNFQPLPARPTPPPLPTLALPWGMVTQRMRYRDKDTLCGWLHNGIAWSDEQRARIDDVLNDYCVGHSTVTYQHDVKHEFTLFWQIDEQQRVRTAHMMKYNADGHRVKKEQDAYCTDWIHSLLTRKRNENDPWPYPQYYNPDKQEHKTSLFGLHLLDRERDADVCIVESEKSALIMAIAYGNNNKHVWMASAGLTNITRERLAPIIKERRRIVLYPDRDGIERWRQQAERLHYQSLSLDTSLVTTHWKPEDGAKADVADVVVRLLRESAQMKTTADVAKNIPQSRELIERLNLQMQ